MRHRLGPRTLRVLLNLWPPFLGAGIRVRAIATDWSYARVELVHGLLNSNVFGMHFGGSLYAMTDPFPAILLQKQLGPDFKVVDQAARIEYLKPGHGRVRVETRVAPGEAARLREAGRDGAKLLPEYPVEVIDEDGDVVARVYRTVYVRRRRDAPPPAGSAAA